MHGWRLLVVQCGRRSVLWSNRPLRLNADHADGRAARLVGARLHHRTHRGVRRHRCAGGRAGGRGHRDESQRPTLAELEAESAAVYRLFDFLTRVNGLSLALPWAPRCSTRSPDWHQGSHRPTDDQRTDHRGAVGCAPPRKRAAVLQGGRRDPPGRGFRALGQPLLCRAAGPVGGPTGPVSRGSYRVCSSITATASSAVTPASPSWSTVTIRLSCRQTRSSCGQGSRAMLSMKHRPWARAGSE